MLGPERCYHIGGWDTLASSVQADFASVDILVILIGLENIGVNRAPDLGREKDEEGCRTKGTVVGSKTGWGVYCLNKGHT